MPPRWDVQTMSIVQSGTTTGVADLAALPRALVIDIPPLSPQMDLFVQGGADASTLRRLLIPADGAGVAAGDFKIASTAGNRCVDITRIAAGVPYLRLETAAPVNSVHVFRLLYKLL